MEHANRALVQEFQFSMPWDMETTWVSHTFDNEIDWNFQLADDPEWTYMLSRHSFVLHLAQASKITNDPRYAQKALWYIRDFLTHAPHIIERESTSWRSLDAAMRVMNWIDALILLEIEADSFIREGISSHVEYLALQDSPFLLFSNWGIIGNAGLFKSALYIDDSERARLAENRVCESIQYQILPDGMHWEQSPLYHAEVLSALLSMIHASKRHNRTLDDRLIHGAKSMAQFMLGSMKPNRHQFLQSDSDNTDLRDVLTRASYLLNDSTLRVGCFPVLEPYLSFFESPDSRKAYEKQMIAQPSFLSFGGIASGNIYLRTGWSEEDSCCHFRCGPLGSGHGHADLLHIDLVAHGSDVLVDSGRFTYCETSERRTLKEAESHSTIIVDTHGSAQYGSTWKYTRYDMPGDRFLITKNDWNYAKGSSLGYLANSLKPVLVEREIIQLGRSICLIHDTFFAMSRHRYDWYFHYSPEGIVSDEQQGSIVFINRRVKSTMWYERGIEPRLMKTPYSPRYNLMDEKPTVRFSGVFTRNHSATFIIYSDKIDEEKSCTIEPLVVRGLRSQQIYHTHEARGWRICVENEEAFEVMIRSKETTELLQAGSLVSYARVSAQQGDRKEFFRF